ncbi:MAG: MerR family transcriptional regulator [Woeseiaceae bacterium]|nr:MerR family transcriptional regulator [Woeseiaceae bacterium]
MKAEKMDSYGIGAVSKMTGLTDHTIRVWERRYSAIVADRSDTGRRLYSKDDVEKLALLKRLTDQGIGISQIAGHSLSELRERARNMGEIGAGTPPEEIRVAVLGDFLPVQFLEHNRQITPLNIVATDNDATRFGIDIGHQSLDYIIVECPVLDQPAIQRLTEYVRVSGARAAMALYKFGTSQDVDRAKDLGIIVVRSPADVDQLRSLLMRAASENVTIAPRNEETEIDGGGAEWPATGEIPARHYTQQQLARLSKITSAIDCECPHHLASLVTDLTAFEIYSSQCANRNEEDAALHRYLHYTTAQARATIETALKKVVEFEKLDI